MHRQRVLHTTTLLNLVSININGVRTKRKRLLLQKLLADLQVGICVSTETHMRRHELNGLKIDDYFIVGEYCRPTPVGERIGGGVLFLVHASFSATKIPNTVDLTPDIEHCTARFCPTDDPDTMLQIAGVYIPPSQTSHLTMERLLQLSRSPRRADASDHAPCILAGDFNTTKWTPLFSEWLQEGGLISLVDPDVPTYALGTSIDKVLFLPGHYIPSTFLPPGEQKLDDDGGQWGDPY